MTVRTWVTSRAFIAAVLASAAIAGVIGSLIVAAQQGDDEKFSYIDPTTFPTPTHNRWIRPDTGHFEAYLWDDHPIAEAEKGRDAVVRPAVEDVQRLYGCRGLRRPCGLHPTVRSGGPRHHRRDGQHRTARHPG